MLRRALEELLWNVTGRKNETEREIKACVLLDKSKTTEQATREMFIEETIVAVRRRRKIEPRWQWTTSTGTQLLQRHGHGERTENRIDRIDNRSASCVVRLRGDSTWHDPTIRDCAKNSRTFLLPRRVTLSRPVGPRTMYCTVARPTKTKTNQDRERARRPEC